MYLCVCIALCSGMWKSENGKNHFALGRSPLVLAMGLGYVEKLPEEDKGFLMLSVDSTIFAGSATFILRTPQNAMYDNRSFSWV